MRVLVSKTIGGIVGTCYSDGALFVDSFLDKTLNLTLLGLEHLRRIRRDRDKGIYVARTRFSDLMFNLG